jgi:hypothetical protein
VQEQLARYKAERLSRKKGSAEDGQATQVDVGAKESVVEQLPMGTFGGQTGTKERLV